MLVGVAASARPRHDHSKHPALRFATPGAPTSVHMWRFDFASFLSGFPNSAGCVRVGIFSSPRFPCVGVYPDPVGAPLRSIFLRSLIFSVTPPVFSSYPLFFRIFAFPPQLFI